MMGLPRSRSRVILATVTLSLAVLPSACGSNGSGAGQPPALVIRATDNDYPDPAEAKAGLTELTIDNQGQELHQIALVRLGEGKTFDDFAALMATFKEGDQLPAWATWAGGPAVAAPGQKASAFVPLEAGTYAMLCGIPDAQGVPHLAKGMLKPLTVTEGEAAAAPPAADVDVKLSDFGFAVSGDLKAGRRVLHAANDGKQTHEAVLVKLNEGATAMEVAAAFAPGGSGQPPAMPVGGVVGITAGTSQSFPVDFTPGRYAFLCFLTDPATQKAHVELGMMTEFDVQ